MLLRTKTKLSTSKHCIQVRFSYVVFRKHLHQSELNISSSDLLQIELSFQLGWTNGGKCSHIFPLQHIIKACFWPLQQHKVVVLFTKHKHAFGLDNCKNCLSRLVTTFSSERMQYFTRHRTLALKQWIPGSWHCEVWRILFL